MSFEQELQDVLDFMRDTGSLDWRSARDRLVSLHKLAQTEGEFDACLGLHKALLDSVERQIPPQELDAFMDTRKKDYYALLLSESVRFRSDGLIDPAKLAAITEREVLLGRMTKTDELHRLAIDGSGNEQQRPSLWKRMFRR